MIRARSLLALTLPTLLACRAQTPVAASRPRARVHAASAPSDLTQGPNASGQIGDYVLENRHIRAVIQRLPGGVSFALSGGSLLDLAPQPDGVDELGQTFTLLGEFPRQLVFDRVSLRNDRDGHARITFRGHDPFTDGLTGETTYSLGPDDRAITLRTTLHHQGPTATTVSLGDALQWGSAEHFAPGAGFVIPRNHRFAWIAGVGRDTAYVYNADVELTGPHGANWSNPSQRTLSLAAGEQVTYERRLGCARYADPARALAATRPTDVAPSLVVHATADGAAVPDVRVAVLDAENHPVALGATNARGSTQFALSAGHFTLDVTAPGRRVVGELSGVDVTAGATARVAIELSPRSALRVTVTVDGHPTASRVLLAGIDGTPDPVLGAIGRADGARNSFVTDAVGVREVALAPGRYRVTATHGTEYPLAATEVTVAEGGRVEATLALTRVIDSTGYVCGDFHQHQSPSLDAPLSLRDRVRADVAEGLEVVASTDHNMATDLREAVAAEGFEHTLLALAGDEVSTDIARAPIGHYNVFPVVVRPEEPRGGAPHFLDLDTPTFLREARAWAPDAVIQVNHPRSPVPTGAFNIVGLDPDTAHATHGAFASSFDAIEVWNGRWQRSVDEVMTDWFALLRAGARITATGNSDSHAIVTQEAGFPRTCVAVDHDAPGAYTAADVVRALKVTRDVFVTDGPFLRVLDADGRSAVGRTLPRRDGAIELTVTVQAPDWSYPDALEYVLSDGTHHAIAATWIDSGSVRTTRATARIPLEHGQFVVIRTTGNSRIPVLVGDPALRPMAFSNPVWAD